jgi:hypothetical protein
LRTCRRSHVECLGLRGWFSSPYSSRRPSHNQRRAVLDVVKALAALDPLGCGLDDICAQLIGSSYVPTKLDLISALTRCASSRMVKISSMPSGIPPQSRQTRSAEADALRATLSAPFNYQQIDRTRLRDQRVRLQVTRFGVGVTPHPRSSSRRADTMSARFERTPPHHERLDRVRRGAHGLRRTC